MVPMMITADIAVSTIIPVSDMPGRRNDTWNVESINSPAFMMNDRNEASSYTDDTSNRREGKGFRDHEEEYGRSFCANRFEQPNLPLAFVRYHRRD